MLCRPEWVEGLFQVQQTYLTEEQVLAELKEAGLPLDVIKHMHAVDAMTLDPDEIGPDPYDDPELYEDGLIDVTPNKEAAE
jgi:hypothetical protein